MEKENTTNKSWKRKGIIIAAGLLAVAVVAFGLRFLLDQEGSNAAAPSQRSVCTHYFTDQGAVEKGQPFETEFPQGRYIHSNLAKGLISNPMAVEEECTLYFVNEEARTQGAPFQLYSSTTGWVVLLDPLAPSQSQ